MFMHRIKLENVLSFGPDPQELELTPLNVLIGPNGSGKSNFIEVIGLLQAAPRGLADPIRAGGGIGDWIWRGEQRVLSARVGVVVENPDGQQPLRYVFAFAEKGQRFELIEEIIANEHPYSGKTKPYFYFESQAGRATLNYRDMTSDGIRRELRPEDINPDQSILELRKDPDHYPELTYLGNKLGEMRLYREWSFGRYTPPRVPQKTDLLNNSLMEDCRNLGLVLNRLRREPKAKDQLLSALCQLYEDVVDFDVIIEGGTVQVFLQEGNISVPATRLSDGTLRYLCLLAILCHPTPPPLVCIEEPELGLHPDILPGLAELMRDASERCQLIVTTHSEVIVDSLSDTPESIVVCEKHQGKTTLRRLDKNDLAHWLEKYQLGELWSSGELGGNRW